MSGNGVRERASGVRVLLVDDEAGFLETLKKRLARRGLEAETAGSGEAALEVLARVPEIDVVLLDVKMPGMDGIEALQRIKAARPLVEVILLTGHATLEGAVDGMRLGAFDYLMKPCEMDDLLAKVFEAKARKAELEGRAAGAGGTP
ncbi:response regulator [Desulfovibrio sp.]